MGAAKRRHGNEWGGAQVDINTPGACVSSGFSLSCLSNKRAQWRWAGGGSGKPADEAKNGLATLPNDGYTVTVPTSRSERAGGQVAAQNNIISMHDWLGNVNDRRECARQCCERLKLETTTVVVMDWMLLQH